MVVLNKSPFIQVKSQLAALPGGEVQEPLLKTNLNSTQWVYIVFCNMTRLLHDSSPFMFLQLDCFQSELNVINRALCKDYEYRRQMMIKRFHVTLQSFAWGERGKVD